MSITTFLILFSLFIVQAYSTAETQEQSQETNYIRVSAPKISEEPSDFVLNPAITQQVLFNLKGQTEEISVNFRAEELDHQLYRVLINRNNELDTEVVAKFPTVVGVKLNFDYINKICQIVVASDYTFDIHIEDDAYTVSIESTKYPEEIRPEHMAMELEDEEVSGMTNGNMILYSVTIGVCIAAFIATKMVLSAKKRRNMLIEDLSIIHSEAVLSASRKVDPEFSAVSEGKLNKSNFAKRNEKTSLTVNLKKELITYNKIEYTTNDPQSLLSTSPTLSVLPTKRYFAAISHNNITSLHENTDREHYQNDSNVSSIVLESTVIKPIAVQHGADTHACTDKNCNKVIFTKPVTPENGYLGVELDMCFDNDDSDIPSVMAIKALVDKMQAEGTLGMDNDPSIDSDDEDQYEAPQLPDYFCCMLCFQGKRNTIVGPCRHVFACQECVDDLLQTYKICVLCANKIDGYEML